MFSAVEVQLVAFVSKGMFAGLGLLLAPAWACAEAFSPRLGDGVLRSFDQLHRGMIELLGAPAPPCPADQAGRPGSQAASCSMADLVETQGHPGIPGRKLSPFWAQELIGADFAKTAMPGPEEGHGVKVGVIDAGFHPEALPSGSFGPSDPQLERSLQSPGTHGDKVANLIFDSVVGVAPGARLSAPIPMGFASPHPRRIGAALATLTERRPQIVNASFELESGDEAYQGLKAIADQGTLFVLAAGNGYPAPVSRTNRSLGIAVGNIGPNGLMAPGSQEDPGVDIAAPAGDIIQSYAHERQHGQRPFGKDEGGEASRRFSKFGGTSAAAPLVTGALANVLGLLPGLRLEEAKVLLKRTAQPTANQLESPRRNGSGMLNAFKLVEVAKRLKAEARARSLRRGLEAGRPGLPFQEEADPPSPQSLPAGPQGRVPIGACGRVPGGGPRRERGIRREHGRRWPLQGPGARQEFGRRRRARQRAQGGREHG
jgi:hypothetical protein